MTPDKVFLPLYGPAMITTTLTDEELERYARH
ncbi:MAG: thiamine biosynthesis protein ThiF, partial [Mesorhizobium sp.]